MLAQKTALSTGLFSNHVPAGRAIVKLIKAGKAAINPICSPLAPKRVAYTF